MYLTVMTYLAFGGLTLCSLLAWVFVIRHSTTEWWSNGEGRYLMRSKIALAMLLTMTEVFQVVQPKPETAYTIAALLFLGMAYALADLLRLQTAARREKKAERDLLRAERKARTETP